MAKKDHIIPTQVISVAGYSLSLMLLVLATALYLGWLPATSDQASIVEQKPAVPVIKSPEVPAKVKVTEKVDPQKSLETTPGSTKSADDAESTELLPPADEPKAEEEPEQTQSEPSEPLDSAQVQPLEESTLEANPLEEEAVPQEPLAAEERPQDKVSEPETDLVEERADDVPSRAEDTLTAQDLQPEFSSEGEERQSAQGLVGNEPARTEQTTPLVGETTKPAELQTTATGERARSEKPEPKVRIVAPTVRPAPASKSPSVVIRIPPDPTEELKVLPRPKVVPRGKPELVQQSPTVVVRIPEVEDLPGDHSPGTVVPRKKPSNAVRIERQTIELQRIETPAPRAPKVTQPPTDPETKTGALVTEKADDAQEPRESAPMPRAKPEGLTRAPAHTAAIAPLRRVRKKVRRKPDARVKKQRNRQRAKRASRELKPRTKRRRAKLTKPQIHRPPATNRAPRQTVSFDQETYCLAIAIYYEAGRKNLRQQVAVSRDILHRVESFNFPNSVCEVVYQYAHRRGKCRYAFACDGLPDRPRNKSVWRRAKMLAKAQINCGARCGCYMHKPNLVSSASGRARRVIRCQAGVRAPAPRLIAISGEAQRLQIKPAASGTREVTVSRFGRVSR